ERMLFTANRKPRLGGATILLAGTSLTLLYRSFFIPGAALTNLFVVPAVWLLFAVGAVQLILLPFQSVFSIVPVMSWLLAILKSMSAVGADAGGGFHLAAPPLWSVAVFLVALAVALSASRRFIFGIAAAGLIGIVCLWLVSSTWNPDTVVLINGGDSDQPAVVYIPQANLNGATVINPGSRERCRAILGYLSSRGVDSIERMLFTANRKPRLGGATILLAGKNVRHIIFPAGYRRSRFAKFAMDKARSRGVFISILPAGIAEESPVSEYHSPVFRSTSWMDGAFKARWESPGSTALVFLRPVSPGEMMIRVNTRETSGRLRIVTLLNSNSITFDIISD
ncbi:MAG: hypothetical protein GXP32_04390, partial [Kiritimatiellaeota bacterium]|nr:hypothetical protein [Kiritimatiellota bacterium]